MNIEHNNAVHISAVLNKLKFSVERGALSVKDIRPIQKSFLIEYLQSYYIPLPLAKKYLAELRIYNKNSKKYFYAVGFKNDEDGYEFCNERIKGYVGERSVTFIRGRDPNSAAINIFNDDADFLSLAAGDEKGRLRHNSLVLNSLHLWREAQLNIYSPRYKVAYTWLHNKTDGKLILGHLDDYFKSQGILHIPMNEKYAPQVSLTAWRVDHKSKSKKMPE